MRKHLSIAAACCWLSLLAQPGDVAWAGNAASSAEVPAYELISFVASAGNSEGVQLQWSTGMEPAGTQFLVERSADRMNWRPAFRYDGEGAGEGYAAYAFVDLEPVSGISYYRLSAWANGRMLEVSDDFAVEYHPEPVIRIYSDQAPGRFTVEGTGAITQVQLLNNRGQFMPMELNFGEASVLVRSEGLEPGTYYVQAVVNGMPVMQPVTVSAGGVFGS